jgi:DNA-directed RNA polymerase specialized sigma24 family protein
VALTSFRGFSPGRVAEAAGFLFQAPGWSDTLNRTQGTQVKDYQLAGSVNRFQTTRWSVVLVSAQSQAPGYREAFADLCKLYWYPLYAFIRHRGYSPEDAQDLVQGFFLHVLEYKALSRVDRSKGKFRSFLLASLQNYLSNEADRAHCLKRGGKAEFVYLDIDGAEDRYGLEPVEKLTPEKIFDARWAVTLLGEAMNRLSREYMAKGKATTFQALKGFLDPINTKRLPSYEEAAVQLAVSVGSAKTLIHRLRKQYAAFVREEINRTVSDSSDVDAEIQGLCEALIAAEGWIMP